MENFTSPAIASNTEQIEIAATIWCSPASYSEEGLHSVSTVPKNAVGPSLDGFPPFLRFPESLSLSRTHYFVDQCPLRAPTPTRST